jgi:hypothetical protein
MEGSQEFTNCVDRAQDTFKKNTLTPFFNLQVLWKPDVNLCQKQKL